MGRSLCWAGLEIRCDFKKIGSGQFLEQNDRVIQPVGVARAGVTRDDAGRLIAQRTIERLGRVAPAGIEGEKRAAFQSGQPLQLHHQPPRDTLAARLGVDQQLGNLATVALVRRQAEIELYGTDQPPLQPHNQDVSLSGEQTGRHFLAPEVTSIIVRKRQNEADAGARMDAGVEQFRESVDLMRQLGGGKVFDWPFWLFSERGLRAACWGSAGFWPRFCYYS